MNNSANPSKMDLTYEPASVTRRIGAMIYDAMLVLAVLAVAIIPFVVFIHVFNLGTVLVPSDVGWLVYSLYLCWQLLVIILFFGFFWTRRGQTLGMQVWKLRVEDLQGQLLRWPWALKRMLYAALFWVPGSVCLVISEQLHSSKLKWGGEVLLLLVLVNVLMVKFSASKSTWHDRMSHSRVVRTPTIH
jgi:uncharacterized RDD family membrane protein YckC